MFVSQAEIDQIRGKMRRRVLELPIEREEIRSDARHPKTGRVLRRGDVVGGKAIKPCPMRKGAVYTLTPRVPYAQYRSEAETEPSRARAILYLIDKCETPIRTVTITVTHPPERHGDTWLIHFAKGDRASDLDLPIFLSKYGDYTMSQTKQAVPGDPEVLMPFAEDLAKARVKARDRRASPQRQAVERARDGLTELQRDLVAMKARNRLNLILKEMGKLTQELSVDEGATLPESVCAARQASAKVEGEPRPCGTESVVSLESAA